jgi:hypothetical protein
MSYSAMTQTCLIFDALPFAFAGNNTGSSVDPVSSLCSPLTQTPLNHQTVDQQTSSQVTKRLGYQISARPNLPLNDPGTATYTEADSKENALRRAEEEFPTDEGWHSHEAKLLN